VFWKKVLKFILFRILLTRRIFRITFLSIFTEIFTKKKGSTINSSSDPQDYVNNLWERTMTRRKFFQIIISISSLKSIVPSQLCFFPSSAYNSSSYAHDKNTF